MLRHAACPQLVGDGGGLVDQEVIAGHQRALRLDRLVAVQIDGNHVLDFGRRLHQAADGVLWHIQLTAKGVERQHCGVVIVGQEVAVLIGGVDGRVFGGGIASLVCHQRCIDDPAIRNHLVTAGQDDVAQIGVGRNNVVEEVFDRLGDAVSRLRVQQLGRCYLVPFSVDIAQRQVPLLVEHNVKVEDHAVDRRVAGQRIQAGAHGVGPGRAVALRQARLVGQDNGLHRRIRWRGGEVALRLSGVCWQRVGQGDGNVERERLADGRVIAGHNAQVVGAGQFVYLAFDALIAGHVGRAVLNRQSN